MAFCPSERRDAIAFAKETVMDGDFDAAEIRRAIDEGGSLGGQVARASQRFVRRAADGYSLEAPVSRQTAPSPGASPPASPLRPRP